MRNLIKKILSEGYWEELYKSKRYTQKFDIGDRVVMNGTVGGKTLNNELGTVLKYKHTGGGGGHPHRVYLIKFDNWSDSVNFLRSPVQADQNRVFIDSRCSDGSCWYTTSDNLEPAPSTDTVFDQLNEGVRREPLDLKVGDIVVVNGTFQSKTFHDNIGTVRNIKGDGEVGSIDFENWNEGHDGTHYQTSPGSFWEFYIGKRYRYLNDYTIEKFTPVDLEKFFLQENTENEFEWVKDLELPIEVGDVFYIVDDYNKKEPEDFKPRHVRYVILITNYSEYKDKILLVKKLCDPHDFTYKKEDYQITNKKCRDYNASSEIPTIEYGKAINLVDSKYWRRVN